MGSTGVLWSWTIQGFLPKPPYNSGETPDTFKPYGVGYVEMACGLKVESRLTVADPTALRIGMPMAVTLVPYRVAEAGEQVATFAFEPADAAARNPRHG
ncbi:MAG TPA: OB-fold domain-containing protein [Burkholderiaceae bacterium]|nr:OB-fold domain-containing protein [Burkholderiaceae bacterium]